VTFDHVTKREQTISGALALAMHLLFFLLLVVGVSWQPKQTTAPVIVELWRELPPAPRSKPEPPPPPEPPKQAPRPEPRPEPKPEPKPVPKPDIALEKLEKERKRKEFEAKQLEEHKKKEEAKKRAEEKKREEDKKLAEKKRDEAKKLAEQKKREDEKKRVAVERQRKEEQARLAKEKEDQLSKLLAKQQAEQAAKGRLDAYSRLVGEKIKRYIVEPPNMQGKPEAIFEVVQIPGGEIMSVTLKRSSGNPAYDAAAERAIRKAQPLPPPPDAARFSEVRELQLIIRPEGKQ
jgi:colicin import membrane protein